MIDKVDKVDKVMNHAQHVKCILCIQVVLSACSSFFRGVLRQNPHPNPLIYLRGLRANDIQSVLDFMYNGEVNVAQDELNSFLAVAEDLSVKGLTQSQTNKNTNNEVAKNSRLQQDSVSGNPSGKKPRTNATSSSQFPLNEKGDIEEVTHAIPVKTEPAPQAYYESTAAGGGTGGEEQRMEVWRESGEYAGYEDQYDPGLQEYNTTDSMQDSKGKVISRS